MINLDDRLKVAEKLTMIGFFGNIILTIFKLIAGFTGRSSAMIADGVHSFSDFVTDIIVIVSFRISGKPADENHNYGHGKFETIAAVLVSIALVYAGILILKSGFSKIFFLASGGTMQAPKMIALYAAGVSIVMKEALYRVTVVEGRRIKSHAVIANAWHHRSDALSSVGTLIGIGGAIALGERWVILDPIASIVVSVFILKAALDIFMPTLNELVEGALSENEVKNIIEIIVNEEGVKDYHRLKTRRVGERVAIEFHILVDKRLTIVEAHNVSRSLENKLKKEYGEITHISIHIEPFIEAEKKEK